MPSADYRVVAPDRYPLDALLVELSAAEEICVDLECWNPHAQSGFIPSPDAIVGWSISTKERQARYVPVRHYSGTQYDPDEVLEALRPFIDSRRILAYNIKYESRQLDEVDIHLVPERASDVLHEVALSGQGFDKLGLKAVVEAEFGHRMVEFEDLFPRGDKMLNIATVPIDVAAEYSCEDSDYSLRLHHKYYDKVRTGFVYQLESQLWPVIRRLEDRGAHVDPEFLFAASARLKEEAERVLQIIYLQVKQATGQDVVFDVRSFKQLGDVLYDVMGLPITVRTPKGAPAVNEMALEKLAVQYPVCRNILTYRSILTNATALGETLPSHIGSDGRVHTSYNAFGAMTGRFSSSSPNLQNQAKKKEWSVLRLDGSTYSIKVMPREAFVPEDGYYLLEFDFKAIEFIIMAALSGEESVVRAYENGLDVHKQTAADMLRIPYEDVTKDQRDEHKTYNYLVIYGGGGAGLSLRSDQSEDEADSNIERFFQVRPHFQHFIRSTQDRARITKRVSTHFGRVIVIPYYYSKNRKEYAKGDRFAINAIIQGTAADMQKGGLIRSEKRIGERWSVDMARLILQTHDSQTWEVHRSIKPQDIVPVIIDAMSAKAKGLPRIQVDAKVGMSWGSMSDYDESLDYEPLFEQWQEKRRMMEIVTTTSGVESAPLVKQSVDSAHSSEPVKSVPIRVVMNPHRTLTQTDVGTIVDILNAFPGENIFVIDRNGEQMPLTKLPTSLTIKTAKEVFLQIFPEAEISSSKETIHAAVLANARLA